MCGDLESDETLLEEFYTRFVEDARAHLADHESSDGPNDGDPLYGYLDDLFRKTLTAAADPESGPTDTSGYDRLCMEPLVFARLAGFMAAHQPLEDDPMRRLMEAVMTGYSEGEDAIERYARHHGHDHGNGRGHTH
jgi:hypothetical protein